MTNDTSDPVPWLDDVQLRHWTTLVGLLMTLPPALDAQLKRDAGMNLFEYHVLVALSEHPDEWLAMGDVAAFAKGSASRLSHAASRLERAGWIRRRRCSQAGRRVEAALTEEGWSALRRSAPGHVREVRRLVIDALTPEQLAALGGVARIVIEATDPTLACAISEVVDAPAGG